MEVEITGIAFVNGDVFIYSNDVSETHLSYIERTGDDEETNITFCFSKKKSQLRLATQWLHEQKAVQNAKPKTFGEAFNAVIGTITTIPAQYRIYED